MKVFAIKPCPKCGEPDYLVAEAVCDVGFKMQCRKCGYQAEPHMYLHDAIAAWNAENRFTLRYMIGRIRIKVFGAPKNEMEF